MGALGNQSRRNCGRHPSAGELPLPLWKPPYTKVSYTNLLLAKGSFRNLYNTDRKEQRVSEVIVSVWIVSDDPGCVRACVSVCLCGVRVCVCVRACVCACVRVFAEQVLEDFEFVLEQCWTYFGTILVSKALWGPSGVLLGILGLRSDALGVILGSIGDTQRAVSYTHLTLPTKA